MALRDEIGTARAKAQLSVLEQIQNTQLMPYQVLELAEAFAWLTSVSQPHGGGGPVTKSQS